MVSVPGPKKTYWLDLFTWTTWQEFQGAGSNVSGFRERRRNMVQAMRPRDVLLCYLTGVSRFVGALEVTSDGFFDESPIWGEESFPWRVRVRPLVMLEPSTGVPVHNLLPQFSWWAGLPKPDNWTGHFRGSPARWATEDGEMVLTAIRDARLSPLVREVNHRKLMRRAYPGGRTPVTIPVKEPEPLQQGPVAEEAAPAAGDEEANAHTEIQYLLLKLGSDMGLNVWVARNDRSREYDGHRFADIANLRDDLPRQFDEETSRTV